MRVALYPRVSGHEQEDNYSIPEQIERMKKYCDAKDWTVYKIYTDSVYTGASMDRPGLQAMIKDCEAGKIDMVLVYKLDRLSRSQKDTMYLIEDVFEKNNVGAKRTLLRRGYGDGTCTPRAFPRFAQGNHATVLLQGGSAD